MQKRQNFARIKTLTYLYMDACERGYDDYLNLQEKIDAIGKVEYHPDLSELKRRHEIAGIQSIIFSAMCMESAIYEYAADHLGDDYVKDHIDKLDTLELTPFHGHLIVPTEGVRSVQTTHTKAALSGTVS